MSGTARRRHRPLGAWLLAPAVAAITVLTLVGPGVASSATAAPPPATGAEVAPTADVQRVAVAQRTRNTLFKVRSAKPRNGGAITKGTLKWKSKRAVEVVGRVNDLCPGDGEPARVDITPIHSMGPNRYRTFYDDRGCEEGAVKFRTVFEGRRVIKRLVIKICEEYPSSAGGMVSVSDCRTVKYGNPHRG